MVTRARIPSDPNGSRSDEHTAATEVDRHVGQRLTAARLEAGLSSGSLASKSGVDLPTLAAFEKGITRPSGMELCRIAQALDVPVSSLFLGQERGGV